MGFWPGVFWWVFDVFGLGLVFVVFWWFASCWVCYLVYVGGLGDFRTVFGGTGLTDLWLSELLILVGTAGDIFLGGLI